MTRSIYGPNPDYDPSKTRAAAPDYAWIVNSQFSFQPFLSGALTPTLPLRSICSRIVFLIEA